MSEEAIDTDALVLHQNIHAQPQNSEDRHQLGAHEVRQRKGRIGGAEKEWSAVVNPGDRLTRQEVVRN